MDTQKPPAAASYIEALPTLVAIASGTAILFVLGLAFERIRYPFELEWMEGGVLDHVRVVLQGQPLYRRPSLEFTPFIYTPLYYWVCAAASKVFGLSLAVARGVSLLCAAGAMAVAGHLVWRESGNRLAGLVTAGLMAAAYGTVGFWYDLARIDSLMLLLWLGACSLARLRRTMGGSVAASLLLVAAFFTKQTALALAIPVLVYLIVERRRQGLVATGVYAALVTGIVVAWDASTGGWFSYYVFTLPRHHPMLWSRWRPLLLDFFWEPVAVLVLLSLVAVLGPSLRAKGRPVWQFYGLLLALAMKSSYAALLHEGGFVNVLIPAYAALSIGAGLGFAWVVKEAPGTLASSLAQIAVVLALVGLSYDTRTALPAAAELQANRAAAKQLASQPGPVLLVSTRSFAGDNSPMQAHAMALSDVLKATDDLYSQGLRLQMLHAIEERRWAAVVMDEGLGMLSSELVEAIRGSYRFERRLYPEGARYLGKTKVGLSTRPEEIWVRR